MVTARYSDQAGPPELSSTIAEYGANEERGSPVHEPKERLAASGDQPRRLDGEPPGQEAEPPKAPRVAVRTRRGSR